MTQRVAHRTSDRIRELEQQIQDAHVVNARIVASVHSLRAEGQEQRKRIRELEAENARRQKALEWALDNSTGSDHPHYPYRRDDGKWVYPYLVNGSPMGGGVGEAAYDTALEAVESAAIHL